MYADASAEQLMKTGMLAIAAVGAAILAAAPLASMAEGSGDWTPTPAQIADIERHINLNGLDVDGPINSFQRYYTGLTRDGRRFIFAEYLGLMKMPRPEGSIHIVSYREMPAIADGGCGVINFDFDPDTRKLSTPYCNFELPRPPPPPRASPNSYGTSDRTASPQ
jgi:hypothetical protein